MGKQKTKSPQSQLSKTDIDEINQTFSFLQSDCHCPPELRIRCPNSSNENILSQFHCKLR